MEDVHLTEAQTAFEDVLQQRRALEAEVVAGDHVDHQHLFHRCGIGSRLGGFLRLDGFVIDRIEQSRHRLIDGQIEVALLRLVARTTRQVLGSHRRQFVFVQLRLVVAIDHTRRAEKVRVTVVIRHVGEAAVELELEPALATAHTAPAVEKNASDNDDANNDQPLAQTEFHEIPDP